MKEGSWTLRFQRSDIRRTNLWLTVCHKRVKSSRDVYRAWGVMFLNSVALLLVPRLSRWWSCEAPWTKKSGLRVSKELFTGRWMATGDRSWSHPVTICTGVMLVIQIGHRCLGITWASLLIFGCVTKCCVPQSVKWNLTCGRFLHSFHLCISANGFIVSINSSVCIFMKVKVSQELLTSVLLYLFS